MVAGAHVVDPRLVHVGQESEVIEGAEEVGAVLDDDFVQQGDALQVPQCLDAHALLHVRLQAKRAANDVHSAGAPRPQTVKAIVV